MSTNVTLTNQSVHISNAITKLGAHIPSVNLPPNATCRPDAPCKKACYARHGRFAFKHIQQLLQNNYEIYLSNPKYYEDAVKCAAYPARFFRWHSAGDIPDMAYLEMMVRIAKELPETKFLAFTKKYEIVNEYLANHNGELPANLTIVFSAWGCYPFANPFNLPVAYVRFKRCSCYIPDDAQECNGYCGECVLSGCSCWDLTRGKSVVFDEHK